MIKVFKRKVIFLFLLFFSNPIHLVDNQIQNDIDNTEENEFTDSQENLLMLLLLILFIDNTID